MTILAYHRVDKSDHFSKFSKSRVSVMLGFFLYLYSFQDVSFAWNKSQMLSKSINSSKIIISIELAIFFAHFEVDTKNRPSLTLCPYHRLDKMSKNNHFWNVSKPHFSCILQLFSRSFLHKTKLRRLSDSINSSKTIMSIELALFFTLWSSHPKSAIWRFGLTIRLDKMAKIDRFETFSFFSYIWTSFKKFFFL